MAGNVNEVEQVVSRSLRDSLAKLQQTTGELDQAVNDLVAACASSRPSNSLPSMLRARSSAASLAAALEVLSKFVMSAMQTVAPSVDSDSLEPLPRAAVPAVERGANKPAAPESVGAAPLIPELFGFRPPVPEPQPVKPTEPPPNSTPSRMIDQPLLEVPAAPEAPTGPAEFAVSSEPAAFEPPSFETPALEISSPEQAAADLSGMGSEVAQPVVSDPASQPAELYELATWKGPGAAETAPPSSAPMEEEAALPSEGSVADAPGPLDASTVSEELPPEAAGFDVTALPPDQQELHRRANRVAKVSMQDVKMLRPKDVVLGKQNKDICIRLRVDIEKAHKEYERRFHAIMDHPVDYFYDWMVEILGDGDPETLGEYPYPSPVLRR